MEFDLSGMRKQRGKYYRSARRRSRLRDYLSAALFLAVIAGIAAFLGARNEEQASGMAVIADGDTIEINGSRIRLEGIDSPEFGQLCQLAGREVDCGRMARNHLRNLVDRSHVTCNGWLYDKYDRLLATCSANGIDLNQRMVEDGWAVSYGGYEAEELLARENNRGLWQGEFMRPGDWRREQGTLTADETEHSRDLFDRMIKWVSNWFSG